MALVGAALVRDPALRARTTGRLTRDYGRRSATRLYLNAWEVGEGSAVGADNRAGGSPRRRGDDQVVRSSGSSLASDMNEQLGVDLRDGTVVVEHGDHRQDVVEEGEAGSSLPSRGQEHADPQLRCGDGGNCNLVVVADGIVEVDRGAFRVDQECRIKKEPGQARSSISTADRMAATSFDHSESGRWRRSRALTSAPWPSFIGSKLAIALPRRTMVKRSPRCSTASRRSAKLRAASVAVISDTKIRLSDIRTEGARAYCPPPPGLGPRSRRAESRRTGALRTGSDLPF